VNAKETVRRNSRTCFVLNMLTSVFFGTSVMTSYYLDVGLSQTQVFILQTVLSVVSFTFDIQFGHLADRIGQRKVMIIGATLKVVQSIYFPFCETFAQFMLALVGTGLYVAALENTTNGVMTLSLKQLKKEAVGKRVYSRYLVKTTQFSNIAYACGILAGGLMVWLGGLAIPYYAQPVVSVVFLVFACRLVDPQVPGQAEHASRQLVVKVLRMMLVDRADIRWMIAVHTSFRLFMMLLFWILQPRMQMAGMPVWSYSLVYALWSLIVSMAAGMSRNARATTARWLWLAMVVLPSLGAALAGLTTGVFGFVALMIGLTVISVFERRLFDSFMYEALPDDGLTHNTELAVGSTIPTVVFALLAPFFGMVVDNVSLSAAFLGVAFGGLVLNSTCVALFLRAASRQLVRK
jgi:MFS family permease